jgi:hypothetical protein
MATLIKALTATERRRRGPLRSPLGGLALIVASPLVALAFVGLVVELIDNMNLIIIGACLAFGVGAWGVNAGRRMRLPDGWEQLRRDPRSPVIFLRPFREDERMTYDSPVGKHLGADVPAASAAGSATAEPKIGPTLRAIGPFVAVGKPGEWLAPFGAARLYLDDHQWHDTVAFLVVHAMAIVLQPDVSPGTSWELQLAVRHVDPRRLLMLVPNSALRPLGFQRVRWLTGQVLPVPLPEDVACDAFMFDERWVARALQFGKKPQLALRPFVEQVRQLTLPQEHSDAFAAFVKTVRR